MQHQNMTQGAPVLVRAELRDAEAVCSWITTPEELQLFAGPALTYPITASQLLATSDDGWTVMALRDASASTVGIGSYRGTTPNTKHLGRLLVDPVRRGQGLGRTLTTLLVEHVSALDDVVAITLNVYAQNMPARRLYTSLGFTGTDVPVRDDHPWAAIRMRLSLPGAPAYTPGMAHLFVLDITYIAGAEKADEHMAAHRDFLARHYASGMLLASGRKEPRTGGIILAQGSREAIDAFVAEDPFTVHGVARCAVTEFVATMTAPALDGFTEAAPER